MENILPRNRGINDRLFQQIELLLADLESNSIDITFPQRLNALIAIGRIQIMFANLRKYELFYDHSDSGAKVREYSSAFVDAASSGSRRRKKLAGPSAADILELDDFGNSADDDPDGAS